MRARRSPSLRARVALVSGGVAALVAVGLALTYIALLDTASNRQLDRTVDTMEVRVAGPADLPAVPDPPKGPPVRIDIRSAPPDSIAPPPDPPDTGPRTIRFADTAVAPVAGAPGMAVVLRPDLAAVDSAVARSRLVGIGVAVAGVLIAAALGWVLAGLVARPLRRLAGAAHAIDTLETLPPLSGRGAREAEELSDALTRMLARLETAHADTGRALASARDFAAVCAHELRTPLTSLRTDLQVLATKDLPAEQRATVLDEVLRTEERIEQTLTDLERLAVGELADPDAYESFDLCDTLDRAVQHARRRHPDITVELVECAPVTLTGLPGGLMLIVTNAVANAVQHGRAGTVAVAARANGPDIEITVDDDGRGPHGELGGTVFDRFVKGPGSPGSGLGLALVRQQAELHSGTAELGHGPLGGARLTVRIAAR
ncbi:HAMP domain-containing sensor histidine kinase [Nocardia arizonensis]|uniref:HAMP domain-containing sensor histidine kinase n=1 Tax=Nocardia arizonensis TaxID=1141647 RepID=UPI0006D1ADA3|nr:HAMP domain-containing sensor histidine kinase [Nocardia arizonensis]